MVSYLLILSFPVISKKRIWKNVSINFNRGSINKVSIFSCLINSSLIFAMFIPFGISEKFPEYRMTSVYVGQIINFFSTFLTFGLLDPKIMRNVSEGDFHTVIKNQIAGKFASYIIMCCIFFIVGIAI